jgi:hypothetical protein
VLAVWGAVSLFGVVTLLATMAYPFVLGGKSRDDRATRNDVRYVLNWSGLGEKRFDTVVRSHESPVYFNGDHFTAYAIRVKSLSEAELTSAAEKWTRGDRLDAVLKEAVEAISASGDEAPWFPKSDQILTDDFYVLMWLVELRPRVTAAQLIMARPSDRMIFYASIRN